jgi:hypothetical protein
LNDGLYSIFDTGASDIYLSTLWFESFMLQLFDTIGSNAFYLMDGDTVVSDSCTYNFPDIYFLINGYWLEVSAEDYVDLDN